MFRGIKKHRNAERVLAASGVLTDCVNISRLFSHDFSPRRVMLFACLLFGFYLCRFRRQGLRWFCRRCRLALEQLCALEPGNNVLRFCERVNRYRISAFQSYCVGHFFLNWVIDRIHYHPLPFAYQRRWINVFVCQPEALHKPVCRFGPCMSALCVCGYEAEKYEVQIMPPQHRA